MILSQPNSEINWICSIMHPIDLDGGQLDGFALIDDDQQQES